MPAEGLIRPLASAQKMRGAASGIRTIDLDQQSSFRGADRTCDASCPATEVSFSPGADLKGHSPKLPTHKQSGLSCPGALLGLALVSSAAI